MRGAGDLIGTAQSGLPRFRIADLERQAALMALISCLMGFAGGLVMSSIKRDRGVKDFGDLIPGHGGIMDRMDSLVFAAPVFFHLTRFFFA